MPGPAIVKATLFFQTGSYGWTESFLWDGLSSNDLNPHMASLQIIAQKRAVLLGAQSFIKAERVSYETDQTGAPARGDSILQYIRYNGGIVNTSDVQDAGVLVTMRNLVAAHRRNMFLRGIWDDVDGAGGFYLPAINGWQAAFNSWSAAMLARGVGWWHSAVENDVGIETYTVGATTGLITVSVDEAIFGAGPYSPIKVRISKVNEKSQLNNTWVGTPITETSIELQTKMALLPYVSGGRLKTYTRSLDVAASIDAQKIVTRRAGAPLLQSRGRQRAKART